MLVLGRKVGEKVFIGENVCVTVLEVKGDRIRLGFEAGKEIPIHRAEVVQQLQEFEIDTPCAEGKLRGRVDARNGDCRKSVHGATCTAS